MYDVKSVSQPGTIALLGNNYSLQIIETGFAEQFYASHRMGPAPICLKISARIAERETYRMIPLKTRLFSHWSIPLSLQLRKYLKTRLLGHFCHSTVHIVYWMFLCIIVYATYRRTWVRSLCGKNSVLWLKVEKPLGSGLSTKVLTVCKRCKKNHKNKQFPIAIPSLQILLINLTTMVAKTKIKSAVFCF